LVELKEKKPLPFLRVFYTLRLLVEAIAHRLTKSCPIVERGVWEGEENEVRAGGSLEYARFIGGKFWLVTIE